MAFHFSITRLLIDARVILETDSGGPLASPRWRFYGLGSRLGSNKNVEMTLSAFKWVGRRPLGLIYIFSPSSGRRGAALSPSWVHLRTLVSWIPELGSGGSRLRAPLGSIGVGRISCVTPSTVFSTRGAELMTLASMAQVSRSVSSLTGTSKWNLSPSFTNGVSIALLWHSTAP